MMPQREIDALLAYADSPNVQQYDSIKEDFGFAVASLIVQYKDPDLLDKMPGWVRPRVENMVTSYRKSGRFGYVSNLGSADHTEMVRELSRLVSLPNDVS